MRFEPRIGYPQHKEQAVHIPALALAAAARGDNRVIAAQFSPSQQGSF
jgi:hypothetical protein